MIAMVDAESVRLERCPVTGMFSRIEILDYVWAHQCLRLDLSTLGFLSSTGCFYASLPACPIIRANPGTPAGDRCSYRFAFPRACYELERQVIEYKQLVQICWCLRVRRI